MLTHHFIKDNQHGSTTLQIIGMSNAANAVFCEMGALPDDIKGAVEASDRVEQTLASGEGFSTAFDTHFESHAVLRCLGWEQRRIPLVRMFIKKMMGFMLFYAIEV